LLITKHAALRMVQRNISIADIQTVVAKGQLFAYSHSGLLKIGYLDERGSIFLSIDQRHQKIITAIRKSAPGYMERLIRGS
jgi:hypothetical protein